MTDIELIGQVCDAVRDSKGLCIRGKSGGMLVRFADGDKRVVLARHLRRCDKHTVEVLSAMVEKRKSGRMGEIS